MHEAAWAKINLYLHVVGRRPDGYHLLDSLTVFAQAADVLSVEPAERLTLTLAGPFAAGLEAGPENLVLRAAVALAGATGVTRGAALTLRKNLPVASGIGGGSADAAATLRLLQRLWGISVPAAALAEIAAGLGADVPVCLRSEASRMGGIGELLGPAPTLPPCRLLLVNPGIAVPTAAVFQARGPSFTEAAVLPARWDDAAAMALELAGTRNDLEAPALSLCPAIGTALGWLRARPGCLLARMSGSGATCYGLFPPKADVSAMAAAVPRGWWGWGGELSA